jgi:transcriptional regulator with XRE-family HTH domain
MNMAGSIRYYRKRAGMYQSDLGKALGISAQAVSKWELGKSEPDQKCIEQMCQMFGVSANQLMGIQTNPEPSDHISDPEKQMLGYIHKLTPENRARMEAYLEGLLAGQET